MMQEGLALRIITRGAGPLRWAASWRQDYKPLNVWQFVYLTTKLPFCGSFYPQKSVNSKKVRVLDVSNLTVLSGLKYCDLVRGYWGHKRQEQETVWARNSLLAPDVPPSSITNQLVSTDQICITAACLAGWIAPCPHHTIHLARGPVSHGPGWSRDQDL